MHSFDKQLANSIFQAVSSLPKKSQQTLKGVAVSKEFKDFNALTNTDPQLAAIILKERCPNLELKAPIAPERSPLTVPATGIVVAAGMTGMAGNKAGITGAAGGGRGGPGRPVRPVWPVRLVPRLNPMMI